MKKLLVSLLFLLGVAHATTPSTVSEISAACNGVTVAYTFPYRFLLNSDLQVYDNSTLLVITTDYTVVNTGTTNGGTVTLTAGSKCANGHTLTIKRTVTLNQSTSFRTQGQFLAATHENAFDKLTMAVQQIVREQTEIDANQDALIAGYTRTIQATAALNPLTALGRCAADMTATVTDAAVGDACHVAPPSDYWGNEIDPLITYCRVSAPNTVTVRLCNLANDYNQNVGVKTFTITVLK